MLNKVVSSIRKYNMISKGDKILAAVSGGPDSVALLHVLRELSSSMGFKLYAAHMNHNLRGKESDGDQKYVEEICGKWGIPLYIADAKVKELSEKWRVSLEDAGRKARYSFFDDICRENGINKIAVAQNSNDNAETILMRILRGTGLEGLSGIKPVRDNIIRPLIGIERTDIEEYCKKNNLNPRIDHTNFEAIYTRNKIRLELIPYLKKEFNENIISVLNRMGNIISTDNSFLNEYANNVLKQVIIKKTQNNIVISKNRLSDLHEAIKIRIIRLVFESLAGVLKDFEQVNIENALEFISNSKTGKTIDLPRGIKLSINYDEIIFSINNLKTNFTDFSYNIDIPCVLSVNELNSTIEVKILDSCKINEEKKSSTELTQFFDIDKLNGNLAVRNRRDGDLINPSGMKGTKKLKDYLIDKKIPKDERDKIPMIAIENEIVWIIGLRTSEKFKVDDNTKKAVMIKYYQS